MRFSKLFALAVATALCFSASARATVVGSKHDLNTITGVTMPQGQICIACHTPHNSTNAINGTVQFLWNHASPNINTSYTLYDGSSGATLDIESRLCLSCHDGAVSVDSFGSKTGTVSMSSLSFTDVNGNTIPTGGAVIASLANQHPVGVSYPGATYANTSATNHSPITWGTVPSYMKSLSGTSLGLTPAGDIASGDLKAVVSCATCHTPHSNANGFFLNMSNANSALCLTCHNE